jgi:hypothetical protein
VVRLLALICSLLAAPLWGQSPGSELDAAYADSLKLVGEQAYQTRYLSIYAIPTDKRDSYRKLVDYWPNGLSVEADIVKPRRVTDTLYAIELDSYGWSADTWEKLLDVPEPWFHIQVRIPAHVKGNAVYYRGGSGSNPGWYHSVNNKEEIVSVPAPWLDYVKAANLSIRLNTAVPIVRFDWFMNQTGQEGGKAGYYQWLGLKAGKDLETLAGLSREAKRSILKEVAGIVADSGVSLNSRQIFRIPTLGGTWWETRDVEDAKKNALRELDKDFKADALEVYYELPNGLFGFALLNAKNELQATAPDTIASDSKSTNRDARVRVGVSCIRCHAEGLRPIDDWGRKVFTRENELALGSPDRKVYQRLKQVYLGPLQKNLKDDVNRYTATLAETCGLKPAEFSKLFASSWYDYESRPSLPADVAREVGLGEKDYLDRLRRYVATQGTADTVLAGMKAGLPTRREHLEEALPLLMPALGNPKSTTN